MLHYIILYSKSEINLNTFNKNLLSDSLISFFVILFSNSYNLTLKFLDDFLNPNKYLFR